MDKCPKCGSLLNIDEKASGLCFTCKATFKTAISQEQIFNMHENSKKNYLVKFILCLSIIFLILFLFVLSGTKQEYIIEKGNVAQKKITAMQNNIWNTNPSVNTDELDKIIKKRSICIIGMIVSTIVGSSCIIIIKSSSSNKTIVKRDKNTFESNSESISNRLQELKSLLDQGLITQEEYELKKGDILKRL